MVITLVSFGFLLVAGTAAAATTGILPAPASEVSLVGPGGILDQIYGTGNLTRIDDDFDQIWNYPQQITATAMAKYAGFNQEFGYIPQSGGGFNSADFVSLFNVTGNGIGLGAPTATVNTGGNNFVWALNPSGAPQWTSLANQNSDGLDHTVTWLISGGARTGNFVIAWEDLPGGGDRDFNDLVVEVGYNPVPEPTTMLLFGAGLVGLAGFGRKKFKK